MIIMTEWAWVGVAFVAFGFIWAWWEIQRLNRK